MPLHVKASDLDTMLGIFSSELPDTEVRAFGSRVAEAEPGPEADLDLALVSGHIISLERIIAIERAMAEAGLPFSVDIFDYSKLTKKFKDTIEKEHIVIREGRA